MPIASLPRVPTDQRGFALLSALFLAVLYFGLMELMLHQTTETLRETQRAEGRIAAEILADNAAELGAENLVNTLQRTAKLDYGVHSMRAVTKMVGTNSFSIIADGRFNAVGRSAIRLQIEGRITGSGIVIERIQYGPN